MNLYVWPTIEVLGEERRAGGEAGYQVSLCAFIGRTVTSVEVSPAAGLAIRFDLGTIRARPLEPDLTGPEIASYSACLPKPNLDGLAGESPFDSLPT